MPQFPENVIQFPENVTQFPEMRTWFPKNIENWFNYPFNYMQVIWWSLLIVMTILNVKNYENGFWINLSNFIYKFFLSNKLLAQGVL